MTGTVRFDGEMKNAKGAYRLKAAEGARKVVLVATGSEVELALGVAKALEAEGLGADVVSMPCWERFDEQDEAYRAARTSSRPVPRWNGSSPTIW